MKIAIIGAGFSGCSIALNLGKKHEVHLIEKEKDILSGASAYNQMRFHCGYHYPRSQKTINEIKKSKASFINFYGKNIFGKTQNFYSIPKRYSKTKPNSYEKFLRKNNLYFKKINNNDYFTRRINSSYKVDEKILNYFAFKNKASRMIKKSNIILKTNYYFKKNEIKEYDKIIIASYSNNNNILNNLGFNSKKKFRYELVEKIIIELPKKFKNKSFVVIDGNFVCCDPYLGTKYHLLSDVTHSKIEIVKNKYPNFKSIQKKFVNCKPVKSLKYSRFKKFINKSSSYLSFLKDAKYIKSMYTIRTLKLDKERTDERTNFLKKINNKIYVVLTGKWNTGVNIARKINKIIQ